MIEYLLQENRILKEQFDRTGKKLKLDNRQRRELAKNRSENPSTMRPTRTRCRRFS